MNHRSINSGNGARVSGVLDDASVMMKQLNRDLGKYVTKLKRVQENVPASESSIDSLEDSQRRVDDLRSFLRKRGLAVARVEKSASFLGIGKKTARQYGCEVGKLNLAGEFDKMREVLQEYAQEYSARDKKVVAEFRAGYIEGSQHTNMQDIAAKLVQIARSFLGEDDKEKKRKKRK